MESSSWRQLWRPILLLGSVGCSIAADDSGSAPPPFPDALHAENGSLRIGPVRGDDDGVTFSSEVTPGQPQTTVSVLVNGVTGGGAKLDAWIDFNDDLNFGGADERIAAAIDVANGDNLITFAIPPDAQYGGVQARFRLSSAGTPAPGGHAADGEVEDPVLNIAVADAVSGQFAKAKFICQSVSNPQSAIAVGVDGDGDPDIVASGPLAICENTGSGEFGDYGSPRVIPAATTGYAGKTLASADLDADGDADLIAGDEVHGRLAWFENDGGGNFTEHELQTEVLSPRSAEAADIDGDGDIDIGFGFRGGAKWLENTDGTGSFFPHDLPTASTLEIVLRPLDFDRDGDIDFVANDAGLSWFENDGAQNFARRSLDFHAPLGATVDYDGDSDFDLISAATFLRIHMNNGIGSMDFVGPARFRVPGEYETAVADLDGDGDRDVILMPNRLRLGGGSKIEWYEFDSSDNILATHPLIKDGIAFSSLELFDLDGDGDLDLLGTDEINGHVFAMENTHLIYEFTHEGPSVIAEGTTAFDIAIKRTGRFPRPESTVTIELFGADRFLNSPADPQSDVPAATIRYTFGANDVNGTIDFPTTDDYELEPDETMVMVITDPTGARSEYYVTIHDNDKDSDGDGLSDDYETEVSLTDPQVADTDGDSVGDGEEVENGTDPLVDDAISYQRWSENEANFPAETAAEDRAPLADPDGDRLANVAEFFFCTAPLVASAVPLAAAVRSADGRRVLCFSRKSGAAGVRSTYQHSNDLMRWDPYDPTTGVDVEDLQNGREQVEVELPPGAGKFWRISLSLE